MDGEELWRARKCLRKKAILQSVDPISENISLALVSISPLPSRTFMTVRWWHRHKLSVNRITAERTSAQKHSLRPKIIISSFGAKFSRLILCQKVCHKQHNNLIKIPVTQAGKAARLTIGMWNSLDWLCKHSWMEITSHRPPRLPTHFVLQRQSNDNRKLNYRAKANTEKSPKWSETNNTNKLNVWPSSVSL